MPRKKRSKNKKKEKPVDTKKCRQAHLESVYVSEKAYVRPLSSSFLCKKFAHYVCSHNFNDANQLLPVLCDDKGVAQDSLLRGCMIIVNSKIEAGATRIDNSLASLLFTFLSSFCLKNEVLLELMAFYLSNYEFQAAQQDLLVRAGKYLGHGYTSENFILIERLSTAYFALLDFVFWWKEIHQIDIDSHQTNTEEALELMASQIILRMKSIINSGPGPFDLIIPRMLDVLLHKNDLKEAQNCLVNYKNKNPTNLNAHIYLFKFLDTYGDQSEQLEGSGVRLEDISLNIVKDAPNSPLIPDIAEENHLPLDKRIQILMNFIDYEENKENVRAWKLLSELIEKSRQSDHFERVQESFRSNFQSYWDEYHWNLIQFKELPNLEEIETIRWKNSVASMLLSEPMNTFSGVAKKWLKKNDLGG